MPVEIVPRPKAKPKIALSLVLYLSLVIFILAIGSYFFLSMTEDSKNEELDQAKADLVAQETEERLELKERLKEYEGKINDFSILLDARLYPLKFFDYLESITHPKVMWTNLSVDLLEAELLLSGQTDSLEHLIQQVLVFEAEPKVKEVELMSFSSIREGEEVSFSLSTVLSPTLFKQ